MLSFHPTTTDRYNYTEFLLRTDPTCPAPTPDVLALATMPVSQQDAATGTFAATLPVIAGIWAQVAPEQTALAWMLTALTDFTDRMQSQGLTHWADITTAHIEQYVHEADSLLDDDTRRLRKNVVHGALLALFDAGLYDETSPAEGIDPVRQQVRSDARGKRLGQAAATRTRRSYDQRVHVRPATHDEVLITRLATRLAGTSRTQHLPAAAVALASSTATTSEAPQVLWADLNDDAAPTVAMPGRDVEPGREETAIAPRTVTLDPWAAQALADWRAEKASHRPLDPTASVLYTGNQALTSNSAQVGADQQIRKALAIADLRREPGLSAGSLRLWATARHVTSFATLADGADAAGVDPLTLHRQVTQQGERALRRSR